MSTSTRRNRSRYDYNSGRARTFGNGDAAARVAARYADFDFNEMHRVQQEQNRTRQEATVNTYPNQGSIDTLYALAASRTPWVTTNQIAKYLETATAEQVAQRIDWLEAQPVAKVHEPAISLSEAYRNSQGGDSVNVRLRDVPAGTVRGYNDTPAAPATRVEVPAGRYAVTGEDGATKFYRVDRPTEGKWKGYTFVKVQAGDELHNVRSRGTRDAVLAKIASDGVKEAMLRYGRELGHCGHCGRTLTNEESREAGIGPVCRGKMGF